MEVEQHASEREPGGTVLIRTVAFTALRLRMNRGRPVRIDPTAPAQRLSHRVLVVPSRFDSYARV